MNQPTKRKSRTTNPIARLLSDGRYQQRVIKDKTKYNRKRNDSIWKRSVGKSDEY